MGEEAGDEGRDGRVKLLFYVHSLFLNDQIRFFKSYNNKFISFVLKIIINFLLLFSCFFLLNKVEYNRLLSK